MTGVGQQMDFSVRATFEDQRVAERDQRIVRSVDDEHRCVIRPVQQRPPRQRRQCGFELLGGRLVVEAHVVADDVGGPEGQAFDVLHLEAFVDRAAKGDRSIDRAGEPCHGGEVAAERHAQMRDLAVTEPPRFLDQSKDHLVAQVRQRDRIFRRARHVEP
jgi:hypothetical protein